MGWKIDYIRAYKTDFEKRYPAAAKDHGIPAPMIPSDKKANGLTSLILRWMLYHGHYANRISTQGQAHVAKIPKFNLHDQQVHHFEQVRWTKGNTKRGTPDITAIVGGRSLWIEVKVGRDRMSEEQEKQRFDIQQAGGLYFIARDMESFVDWYYEIISPPKDPDLYTTPEGYND